MEKYKFMGDVDSSQEKQNDERPGVTSSGSRVTHPEKNNKNIERRQHRVGYFLANLSLPLRHWINLNYKTVTCVFIYFLKKFSIGLIFYFVQTRSLLVGILISNNWEAFIIEIVDLGRHVSIIAYSHKLTLWPPYLLGQNRTMRYQKKKKKFSYYLKRKRHGKHNGSTDDILKSWLFE